MSWHIDGIGGGGGRIAAEFWKNTNIGLKGSWIIAGPNPDDPKEEGIGDVERGNDPGYYIFTDLIADLKDTIKRVRGHEGIDIWQYNKRMEVSMSAFSIEEVRNKIARGISTKVFKSDLVPEGGCESILFAFEFGGGLETKVLNIVSEELHKKTWAPIYALGALSDSGVEEEEEEAEEGRVHFNTAWALRNLLVKKRDVGVDALFLVEKKAIEGEEAGKNSEIFECLLPMINPRKLDEGFTDVGLREKLTGGISMPQTFVPCYYAAKKEGEDVKTLLEKATENCLMGCDYTKADSVIVFTSLLLVEEKEEIVNWVKEKIKNEKYLFSWENVIGDDRDRLLKFLEEDLDIDWAENAKIRKSDDGKTLRIFKDENSAEIKIDEETEKTILKINDGRTHRLKVKIENGKLNLYNEQIPEKRIHVCRVWNSTREVLMLLRNPYGGVNDPFFERLKKIISNAIAYAKSESSKEEVNTQILEGFNDNLQTKLSEFIIKRLIPDLEE